MSIPFTKYHGLSNDFILVNALGLPHLAEAPDLVVALCDRHTGIGADGLALVLPASDADFRMRLSNSDGSVARMCGNGIRCFARFVYEQGLWDGRGELSILTDSGLRTTEILDPTPGHFLVRANLKAPRLDPAAVPTTLAPTTADGLVLDAPLDVDGVTVRVTTLSLGNPHAVVFVDDLAAVNLSDLGPRLERHPVFPDRTNAHFVEIVDGATLRMRTWERGAGLTLACGTGAAAATVAAALTRRAGRRTTVHVPSGQLSIEWDAASGDLYMTGPAARAFEGVVAPELLATLAAVVT